MTQKQIDTIKEIYPEFEGGKAKAFPPYITLLQEELHCRDMINCCLCYSSNFDDYRKKYAETLGEGRVQEIYEEQLRDFSKAKVLKNVYVDSEGVSYNSIIWEDDENV